jgi:Spy/CpxP family protein refolding chaperone
MKTKHVIVTAIITLLAMGSMASGCRHHDTPEEKMHRVIEFLTGDMNLTGEQIELLDKLKTDLIHEAKDISEVKESARDVIIEQIRSDIMDQNQVMAAIDSVRTEIEDVLELVVSRFADFHQTLSPEQKEQLIKRLEMLRTLRGYNR